MTTGVTLDPLDAFRRERELCAITNANTERRLPWISRSYHRRVQEVYRHCVPAGSRVLEIGCGNGDLLDALSPARGVGLDVAHDIVRSAIDRHPHIDFRVLHGEHASALQEEFDAVILSDLLHDVWDVQSLLCEVRRVLAPRGRVVLNFHSRLWSPFLHAGEWMKISGRSAERNWLTVPDVANLARLSGFEVVRTWHEYLMPLPIPLVSTFCNRVLPRLPVVRHLSLSNFMVLRAVPRPVKEPSVSIVVPARNEEGNAGALFARIPDLGPSAEWIIVEGHSLDGTRAAFEKEIAAHPGVNARLLQQPGRGKADAVRCGFESATGDILMILDADLTVPPEDLPRFYTALANGTGDFINGVRLVYPMEGQAMRPLNFLGNKFFGLAFSWLLGQPVKDTLCGTKVLWRTDYEAIVRNRSFFGDFDPFGDFDLLFGAAKLNLRIVDLPVRYRQRTWGTTNIDRWRHGALLLRMCAFAAARLKFI